MTQFDGWTKRGWTQLPEDLPVDVLPASNGEYFPGPATPQQLEIMARADVATEFYRRKFGMSRRRFVRTSTAMAIGFWAIDSVMAGPFGSYGWAHNTETTDACDLEWDGSQGLETLSNLPGEFIFDVQSHHVDPEALWRISNPAFHAFFAAIWPQGSPITGDRIGVRPDGSLRGGGAGELDPMENLNRFHYLKELFLDSATTMTVLSCVPSSPDTNNPLPLAEAALTVNTVNKLANSQRSVLHAFVMPNRGSGPRGALQLKHPLFFDEEMELMHTRAREHRNILRGWKTYCAWGDIPNVSGWYLDSEVGLAFLENVKRVSEQVPEIPPTVASHKGFALPGFDQTAAAARDVGPAARQNPDVNLIIYHSGYDTGDTQRAYRGDATADSRSNTVDGFIKSLRENNWDASHFIEEGKTFGNVPNVWAELGSVWRDTMHDPNAAAHLLGKLINHVGPKRIAWGTDSLWYGSPQSEIVALRRLQFSDQAKELYNLPHGLDGDVEDPDAAGAGARADDPQRDPRSQRRPGLPRRSRRAPPGALLRQGQRDPRRLHLQAQPRRRGGAVALQHHARWAHAPRGAQGPRRGRVDAMSARRLIVASVAATALLASATAAQAATCAAPDVAGGEWPFYSGTLDGHREQLAETTISAANVSELGVAWQRATPDGGTIHSTPVVADGCVFTGTDLGNVYALNADSGEVVWTRDLADGAGSSTFAGAGIVGSPAVADGLVYVGATTPTASVISALDLATGALVWQSVVDEDDGGGLDSSPVPFNGMIFQAFKGDESSAHSNPGFAILDGSRAGGGAILVTTRNIPADDFAAGYRGSSTVGTPSVDLERKLIFAGTGNPASKQQHPITNSLIKIDADPLSATFGQILDSHRGTSDSYPSPQDIDLPTCQPEEQWPVGRFSCAQFDFNFLASQNLWKHSDGRQMFGGLQKSGVYTAIYTDTMDRAWQATVGLPCFACNLSSTAADATGIYVAVSGGNLYKLDRDTGAVKWVAPLTGTFRYNGLAVANGVVYSLNDAFGTLQAFDASNGLPLLAHPFALDTQDLMHDMGNSSGVSVARNTVFATSQGTSSTSTLFALKLGAGGGGGGGGGPGLPELPGGDLPGGGGTIATAPGAASYGYLTPVALTSVGGRVSYTNADIVRHNVVSVAKGLDGQPLFQSELAALGETVQVVGTENLEAGKTYEFLCQPHPNMKGQLVVR